MQEKLYSKKAPVYDPYMPLKEGKKGTPVKLMQQRLFDLGYFTTNDVEKEVDGVYGMRTTEAIKLFQTVCGYEEKKITGVADADTLMLLFDEKAPVNPGNVPPTPTSPVVIVTPTPTNVPTNVPTATPNLPDEPTEVPTATPAPTDVPTATPAPPATPAPAEVPPVRRRHPRRRKCRPKSLRLRPRRRKPRQQHPRRRTRWRSSRLNRSRLKR